MWLLSLNEKKKPRTHNDKSVNQFLMKIIQPNFKEKEEEIEKAHT